DNMSERAKKLMREDINNLGPIRLREVDEAQAEIVSIAKELAARGEIIIGSPDGDDEIIY
ncbi:MAG: FliG C-terminal domain-containing protein, partial [Pseudomonadota bacterium]|nr:FliG C-terminal domain-containing protein [Pseudomonadota bacterium]